MNSRTLIVALSLVSSAAFASGKKDLCHDGKGVPVAGISKKDDCKAPNVWGKPVSNKNAKKSEKVDTAMPVSTPEQAPVEAPKK